MATNSAPNSGHCAMKEFDYFTWIQYGDQMAQHPMFSDVSVYKVKLVVLLGEELENEACFNAGEMYATRKDSTCKNYSTTHGERFFSPQPIAPVSGAKTSA